MEYKAFGISFDEEDLSTLVLVRALEWEALPVFATRSVAPIALFWFTWWQVLLALVVCSLPWCLMRGRLANLRAAIFFSLINNLYISLALNIVTAIILFSMGKLMLGFVSLLWHFISSLLAFAYPPTRNTFAIRERFLEQIK